MNDNFNENNDSLNFPEPVKDIIQSSHTVSNQNFTNSLSLSVVKSISGWGMFRAVIDIISGAFSCLGGVVFLLISLVIFVSGNSASNSLGIYGNLGNMSSNSIKIVGGIFLLCSVIYPFIGVLRIIYSINLIKAIDNLKKAVALNNESGILEFLNKLSKFFKFNGIVSILKISLYIILVLFYIILIIFIASAANNGDFMNEFNNNSRFF